MSAMYVEAPEPEFVLPILARRVQEVAKGAGSWTQLAEAALEEFVRPLRVLCFAALERSHAHEPFVTVLSHGLPVLKVGEAGSRAMIAPFLEAAATPGKVFLTEEVARVGTLACAALSTGTGSQRLIVLAARGTSLTPERLGLLANQLLELVRPAAGGVSARPPADAVSIAIRRAKREWETVADGLPAMVGLADASGRVLRVSRAWTKGRRNQLGRSIHSLLHGDCNAPDCRFARTLAAALRQLPAKEKLVVKTRDKERDGVWVVFLRFIPVSNPRDPRIVFSISKQPRTAATDPATSSGSRQESERLPERKQSAEEPPFALGQSLSVAKLAIERAMAALRGEGDYVVLDELERSAALIQRVIQDAEGIPSRQLPALPEDVGLARAIRALCMQWQADQGEKDLRVVCAVDDRNVPQPLWLTICRIVQESLQETAASPGVEAIGITLIPGDRSLLLAIDMSAMPSAGFGDAMASSAGMMMMRELAEFSGGTFRVDAMPDGGASVQVLWPRPADVSRAAAPSVH